MKHVIFFTQTQYRTKLNFPKKGVIFDISKFAIEQRNWQNTQYNILKIFKIPQILTNSSPKIPEKYYCLKFSRTFTQKACNSATLDWIYNKTPYVQLKNLPSNQKFTQTWFAWLMKFSKSVLCNCFSLFCKISCKNKLSLTKLLLLVLKKFLCP